MYIYICATYKYIYIYMYICTCICYTHIHIFIFTCLLFCLYASQQMVQFLMKIPDHSVLPIVAARLGNRRDFDNTFLDEILQIDEALDCLDKAEEKDVRKHQSEGEASKEAASEYLRSYSKKFAKVQAAREAAIQAASKSRARAKPKAMPAPAHGPVALPAGELSQNQIKVLLPPETSVWRANQHHAWMGHCPPFPRVSAPWAQYGHRYAAIRLLRTLWGQWAKLNNKSMPSDCTVQGLFEAEASEEAAAQVVG